MQSRIKGGLFQGVDFLAVLYYLLLVAAGCICITAASFDEETADFFAFSHFYIKQYMWVTAVLVVALVVLLLDVRYYHMWAYPLYIIGIVVMIGVLIAGKEVNGAKSWIELGSLRIQPVEFVKIATALALARVMSNYSFSINRFGDLLRVGVIVGIPMLLTILQNDTGSGIVLGAFLFVLYREGLNKCFVPADAHDAAGAADPDLRGVGGDDERPMAFAHRLPRLAGALGHRPLVAHGTHRPRHDGHLP